MNDRSISRIIIQGISDFLSIKAVRYIIIILIVGFIMSLFAPKQPESVVEQLMIDKNVMQNEHEKQTGITWEERQELYKVLTPKIKNIIENEETINAEELKLLEIYKVVKGREYTFSIDRVKKYDDEYNLEAGIDIWESTPGLEDSNKRIATIELKVRYENKNIRILNVSKID